MTIIKKPQKPAAQAAAIEAFISAAPDATPPQAAPQRVRKGRKVQITLTISEDMLSRVDAKAAQIGQSRAAVINLAIAQLLETGINLGGSE